MRTAPELLRDLPVSIQDLIVTVVRRTGLWRSEKRDVLAELRAHFVDGLAELEQEGVTADRAAPLLIERFGDPRQAARLIRRGKKRARPLLWKAWVGSVRAVGVCVLALLLYIGWIYTGKPTPSVDYVAKLQRSVEAIPESDRSWPLIHQVSLQLPPMPEALDKMKKGVSKLRPSDAEFAAAREWVIGGRGQLEPLHQAAQRRVCGWTYDNVEAQRVVFELQKLKGQVEPGAVFTPTSERNDGPRLMSMPLPHLSLYRQMARFLVVTALVRSADGDVDGAIAALDDAHRLGGQLLPSGILIEQLVGVAMINMSTQTAQQILYDHRNTLTAAQLQRYGAMPLVAAPVERFSVNLSVERDFFYDVVQHTFTDDGHGDGHVLPRELGRMIETSGPRPVYAVTAFHAGRKATLEKFDELWKEGDEKLRLPLYDPQRAQVNAAMERLIKSEINQVRYSLITMLTPSLARADQNLREAAMLQDALRTIVALLAWHREHGQYPERLAELVPGKLPRIPEDVFSGEPLKYARRGSNFTLYSLGPNLEDNGGDGVRTIRFTEVPPERRSIMHGGKSPLDTVYWPPTEPQPETQESSDEQEMRQRRLTAESPESASSQPAAVATSAPATP